MKIICITFLSMSLFQSLHAAQICKDYIPNDWKDSRYLLETISGDHVVTDLKTGLMWKQCSEGLTGASCSNGSLQSLNWEQSLHLAQSTSFAGSSNWRVPNQRELISIIARNCIEPSLNETIFPMTSQNHYWSSSPVVTLCGAGPGCDEIDNLTWGINLHDGLERALYRESTNNVRLVRSIPQSN